MIAFFLAIFSLQKHCRDLKDCTGKIKLEMLEPTVVDVTHVSKKTILSAVHCKIHLHWNFLN